MLSHFHLFASQKLEKKLEKWFDRAMYGIALCAPIALLPQVYQIYATKQVGNLSLITWGSLMIINILWVAWGSVHRAYPIVISSFFLAILNASVVIGIFMYR